MPRRPARLSNCYVPLPIPKKEIKDDNKQSSTQLTGRRLDPDRNTNDELRQILMETSVFSNASDALGSSIVELGHTKVICEIHIVATPIITGSTTETSSSLSFVDTGHLHCIVQYAPHVGLNPITQRYNTVSNLDSAQTQQSSGSGASGSSGNNYSSGKLHQQSIVQETQISQQLSSSLLPVLQLQKYPKCTIIVKVMILQDDGCSLSASILSSTLALMDARIEMYDIVTSCTVAVLMTDSSNDDDTTNNNILYLVDPTETESTRAQALICIAMTPNHKEVTLWSQSGKLTADMASTAMELCRNGCRTYHKFIKNKFVLSTSR